MKRQNPPPKVGIDDRLNAEMRRLQKAAAILACVAVASEHAEERIDLGDAVGVALQLVQESIRKLDGMALVV